MSLDRDVLWAQLSKDTSNVIVKHSSEWGRYFVAARDFEEDEAVHSEEAYLLLFLVLIYFKFQPNYINNM